MKAPYLVVAAGACLAGLTWIGWSLGGDGREVRALEATTRAVASVEREPVNLFPPPAVEEEQPEPIAASEAAYVDPEFGEVTHEPKVRKNPDGTLTIVKLVRVVHADGTVRELPVKATATPRTMPIEKLVQRTPGGGYVPAVGPDAAPQGESSEQ